MTLVSKLTSNRKMVWITILIWVFIAGGLSMGPSANDHTVNTGEDDLPKDAKSVIAEDKVQAYFPDDDGQLALLVFTQENEWNEASGWDEIASTTEWLTEDSVMGTIDTVVPFHHFPEPVREEFRSEDGTTMVIPLILATGLEMDEINDTVTMIDNYGNDAISQGELYVTGPAGIASDTIAIFSNADLTLLFSTIGLVLVLLIIIYRSPLLAIIPLLAAGFVYQITDKVLGLFAANGVFTIETQSLSIVMILLFGATTDYSLFIFSRFREELRKQENKYDAMSSALRGVAQPIFFSGGTVFVAMLVLLLAQYGPYNNFALTFAITISMVLLAGLTLIPALFTVAGRRAFWPVIPQVGEETLKKNRFWGSVGTFVTKKPVLSGGIVLVFLIVNALNVPTIQHSFNLINSFPEDMKSRIGFEVMEESYPPGDLAPVSVIVESENGFDINEEKWESVELLGNILMEDEGVYDVTLPDLEDAQDGDNIDESGRALSGELILEQNPYDHESLNTIDRLNDNRTGILEESGLDAARYNLFFSGESAKQADVRALNDRDTIVVALAVTVVITLMLIWQTRSLVAPLYMMSTILLSYLSALGLSWFIFHNLLGFEAMSYRIPLYAFVFLVALGVDYNIMLISRIREENRHHSILYSVQRGVALTGGVISSAGLILAATFGVLMTQPLMELYMFGFIVGLGILLDAFLVRGMLVPAIVTLLGKWNWWPGTKKNI